MRCRDPEGCPCLTHLPAEYAVPCCPHCRYPLIAHATDSTHGRCMVPRCPYRARMIPPAEFTFLHRDTFPDDAIPPRNGWEEPRWRDR